MQTKTGVGRHTEVWEWCSVLLLAGHVPHQIVDELVHLLDVLGGVRLVLETHHVVRHLDHQAPLAVVIFGGVSDLVSAC